MVFNWITQQSDIYITITHVYIYGCKKTQIWNKVSYSLLLQNTRPGIMDSGYKSADSDWMLEEIS